MSSFVSILLNFLNNLPSSIFTRSGCWIMFSTFSKNWFQVFRSFMRILDLFLNNFLSGVIHLPSYCRNCFISFHFSPWKVCFLTKKKEKERNCGWSFLCVERLRKFWCPSFYYFYWIWTHERSYEDYKIWRFSLHCVRSLWIIKRCIDWWIDLIKNMHRWVLHKIIKNMHVEWDFSLHSVDIYKSIHLLEGVACCARIF